MYKRILLAVAILVPFISASEARAQFEGPTSIKIGLSTGTVAGTKTVTGNLLLNSPAKTLMAIELSSDKPGIAQPARERVEVSPGQTSIKFLVTTSKVTQNTAVRIKATVRRLEAIASLQVTVGLESINIVPGAIAGGNQAVGTLSLSGAPPAGAQAVLVSSNPQVLRFGIGPFVTAAATTSVALNSVINQFSVITSTVDATTTVTITATYNGVATTKVAAVLKPPGS